MKKLAAILMALMLCFTMASAVAELNDGTYQAVTQGKIGPVTVEVKVEQGALAAVQVVSHSETTGLFEEAFEKLPAQIVENQTVNVDVISGSTVSSTALIDGVKDCIAQAGGIVENFMTAVEKTLSTEVIDCNTQIVVIGAGASGLTAAVEAQELGAQVIVLEKNSSTAQSTSNLAAGLMAIGSRAQENQGVVPVDYDPELKDWNDVVDAVFDYWTEQMSWHVNQKVVYNYLAMSGETTTWLMDHGFEFIRVMPLMPSNRWYHTNTNNHHLMGKGKYSVFAEPMFTKFEENGGKVYYNTKAEQLVTDENGKVCGVKAVMTDGTTLNIAADAVILCSGGFGSDLDYVYNELGFNGAFEGAGAAGMGDGMRMAWEIGAQKYKEDALLVHHLFTTESYTDLTDFGNKMNCILNYIPSFVHLNPVGTRYSNEDGVKCGVEASEATYGQAYAWNVFTQDMADALVNEGTNALGLPNGLNWVPLSFGYQPKGDELWTELPEVLTRMENEGVMVKADTLEELAAKTGMDYDILTKNIEEYNACCKAGEDKIFKKDPACLVALEKGPYYAMQLKTRYISSIGGLKIDENMSVLDENEREIEGLYAAGCDAAAVIYGDAYVDIDGAGFGWAFTSGRMAAQAAVEDIK